MCKYGGLERKAGLLLLLEGCNVVDGASVGTVVGRLDFFVGVMVGVLLGCEEGCEVG